LRRIFRRRPPNLQCGREFPAKIGPVALFQALFWMAYTFTAFSRFGAAAPAGVPSRIAITPIVLDFHRHPQ
jgi:hypothetical protein